LAEEKNKSLTQFQRRVYRAVLAIPRGETRSYKWVAKKTLSPKSFRAVGSALGKNPYPGIVPCHRVIKEDGSPGGFYHGPKAKIKLLEAEGLDMRSFKL